MRRTLLLSLLLAACSRRMPGDGAYQVRPLGRLPLLAETPASASLSTDDTGAIVSDRACVAAIHPVLAADPPDLPALEAALGAARPGTTITAREPGASAWFLAYEVRTGAGVVRNFERRTTIDGVAYRCSAFAASPNPTTCEERICRSLRSAAATAPSP